MDSPMLPDPELDRLLSGLADGTLDSTEEKELASRLRTEPETRRHYLRYQQLHGELQWEYANAARDHSPSLAQPLESTSAPRIWPLALAALLFLGLFVGYQFFAGLPRSIASVVSSEGARLDDGESDRELSPGDPVTAGTVRVESPSGFLELFFEDETSITLGGDSELGLQEEGGKLLLLRSGKITAQVSPQDLNDPLVIGTPEAEIRVIGTTFSVQSREGITHLHVEQGLVVVRRLSDGMTLEVPAEHELDISLDSSVDLVARSAGAPPTAWLLNLDGTSDEVTKGIPVSVANRPCLDSVPYVAGRKPDGTKVVRNGLSINGDLAKLTSESRIHLRYRSDWGPIVFLSTEREDGGFGGNFEYRLSLESYPPGPDGWMEVEIPLADFRPIEKLKDRGFSLERGTLSKILVSVHEGRRLQVSEIEIRE